MTFADIYGLEEVKAQFREIIQYFSSDKKKYKAIGARLKKGVLLYGPTGTGKTLMARAVAGESGVNFIYQPAPEFIEKFVGVGGARVRDLFRLARDLAPCIIFIDEIDALGTRVFDKGMLSNGGTLERNNTINQLLTELDGFRELKEVLVIAATNNIEAVDPALIRAGRFDIKIGTRMPDEKEREGILRKKLEKVRKEISEEMVKKIAEMKGFSGADIDSIVNEAAFISLRKGKEVVDDESLFEAANLYAKC